MSEEFKTIETQEALDAIIKSRLERNTKSVTDSVTAEVYYTTNFRNVKIFCNWTGTCGKPERIRVQ